jgi:hypothetical protein
VQVEHLIDSPDVDNVAVQDAPIAENSQIVMILLLLMILLQLCSLHNVLLLLVELEGSPNQLKGILKNALLLML